MRNIITNELVYFFNPEKKISKKELIKKLESKNYFSSISLYNHLYINIILIKKESTIK